MGGGGKVEGKLAAAQFVPVKCKGKRLLLSVRLAWQTFLLAATSKHYAL